MVILQPTPPRYAPDPWSGRGCERLEIDLALLDTSAPRLPAKHLQNLLDRISSEPARVETDREGLITSINPAFTDLCGFSFSEIKGRKPGSFLQGADTDQKTVTALRQAVQDARTVEVEIINYHKDGSAYRAAVAVEPVRDQAGQVTGFRAIAEKLPL